MDIQSMMQAALERSAKHDAFMAAWKARVNAYEATMPNMVDINAYHAFEAGFEAAWHAARAYQPEEVTL